MNIDNITYRGYNKSALIVKKDGTDYIQLFDCYNVNEDEMIEDYKRFEKSESNNFLSMDDYKFMNGRFITNEKYYNILIHDAEIKELMDRYDMIQKRKLILSQLTKHSN